MLKENVSNFLLTRQ